MSHAYVPLNPCPTACPVPPLGVGHGGTVSVRAGHVPGTLKLDLGLVINRLPFGTEGHDLGEILGGRVAV